MTTNAFRLFVGLVLLLLGSVSSAQTVARVNCDQKGSVNAALAKYKGAGKLVIQITGMCTENVVVDRNALTLLGTDPATDGVRAPAGTAIAVLVDGSRDVILQNLRVTGGTELGVRFAHSEGKLINCRAEGNGSGAEADWSYFSAEDSTFSFNTLVGLVLYGASFGRCTRCTIADNTGGSYSEGLEIGDGSFINLFDTDISGSDTGITVINSRVIVRAGSTVSASQFAISTGAGAVVHLNLEGAPFSGSVDVQNSIVHVNGSQTLNPNGNTVYNKSHLTLGAGASLLGVDIGGFSSAVFGPGSAITGNLSCGSGGDAFCVNPSSVTGSANCGQCTKP